jgi:hypothetical protein
MTEIKAKLSMNLASAYVVFFYIPMLYVFVVYLKTLSIALNIHH